MYTIEATAVFLRFVPALPQTWPTMQNTREAAVGGDSDIASVWECERPGRRDAVTSVAAAAATSRHHHAAAAAQSAIFVWLRATRSAREIVNGFAVMVASC